MGMPFYKVIYKIITALYAWKPSKLLKLFNFTVNRYYWYLKFNCNLYKKCNIQGGNKQET